MLGIAGRRKQRRFSTQRLIVASDWTFLGGFKLPPLYPTADRDYARGLTIRYRSGNFRLMTLVKGDNATNGQAVHLYEFSVPTLQSAVASYQDAPITTHYGSTLWGGRMDAGGPSDTQKDYRSLYWDETLQKLFFVACSGYSNTTKNIIGVATLNDGAPTSSTSTGMWRFDNMSYKAIKGILPVPASKQSLVGGRRLLAGFGGYESIIAAGPAHMGPAAVAFDPTAMIAATADTAVSGGLVLASHPYGLNKYQSPYYGVRSTSYYSSMAWDWNPDAGTGYFTSADSIDQSAVWIETPTRRGFVIWSSQCLSGAKVSLDPTFDPVFVSKTGDANGNTWTWDFRTQTPFAVGVGNTPFVGNTVGGISFGTIVSQSGNDIRVALTVSSQDNGVSGPVPNKNGEIYLGTSYFAAQITASLKQTQMFCYNPDDLVSSVNPLPPRSIETFTGPVRYTTTGNGGDETRMFGATFDPTTNRLYLLTQGGLVGVYQLSV